MQAARRGRTLAFDGPLTLVVGAFALVVAPWAGRWQVPARHPIDPLGSALIVAAVAPLLVRRLWPQAAVGLCAGAIAVYLALGYPYGPVLLAPLIAVYSAAASLPVTRSLGAAGLTAAALFVPHAGDVGADPVALLHAAAWATTLALVPWAVGAAVRFHRLSLEHDRETEVRRRAYEERLDVAREVHDVVGHGLAVINMQAAVALHVLERRPEQARVALEAIKQASKESLDELRGTLAVFRQPDGGLRPAPGLGELEALAAAMADSGLPVEVLAAGDPTGLPAAVDLAAYRIVQESLTNVARHADATAATVRVEHGRGELVVEVTDDGRGRGDGRSGHGIDGMRERAAALGGELEAGPRAQGGFRVRARLPWGPA